MAKIQFEMEVDLSLLDENLEEELEVRSDEDVPLLWTLSFAYDDKENSFDFYTMTGQTGVSDECYEDIDWIDFLKLIGREADGDFVNSVHEQAHAFIALNLHDAYQDE
jgi:hypothetical protein